jgi:hypothetical protein
MDFSCWSEIQIAVEAGRHATAIGRKKKQSSLNRRIVWSGCGLPTQSGLCSKYGVFQKELYNFQSLHKFSQRICSVLNCHNVAKHRSSKLLYDWQFVLVLNTLVGLATRRYLLSVCCCLKFAVLFLWGVLSDERTCLQFAVQSLNGPSRAEPVTILCCLIWDSSNLEGQVPVFISPKNRMARL